QHDSVPGFSVPVFTEYLHMAKQSVKNGAASNSADQTLIDSGLHVGDTVTRGQLLGRQGNWQYFLPDANGNGGNDYITHLHFGVSTGGAGAPGRTFYDPQVLLGTNYRSCSLDAFGGAPTTANPSLDIAFVIDTTGSMGPYIGNAKANATSFLTSMQA